MKTKKTLLLLAALLLLALCLAACQPTYTLTFKVEGTDDMTVSVPKGSRAVAPYVETAKGVTLDGWYTDEARTERFDFSAAVSGDMTLWARFKTESYDVVYDVAFECDESDVPKQNSVNFDGTFVVKDAPQRVGYKFNGWTDGKKIFQAGDTYTVSDAQTVRLTATWEYRTVDVTFVYNQGEQTRKVLYGADVQPPEDQAVHEFFCFDLVGWEGGSMRDITENVTFEAVYEYVPTDSSLFDYELTEDKKGYILKEKPDSDLPAYLALPDFWQGLPVVGVHSEQSPFSNFMYQSKLERLYIPGTYVNGVKAPAMSALKTVVIGEGVRTLPDHAFNSCTALTDVYIPASLESLGGAAFANCPSVYFEFADNAALVYTENSIRSADGTEIFYVDGSVTDYTIGSEVTWINVGLFGAFAYNALFPLVESQLKSVTINANLRLLPTSTFYHCFNLESVTFNGVIEEIGGWQEYGNTFEEGGMVFVDILANSAFSISDSFGGAGKLTSLTFKPGLKRIGASAFAQIDTLKSITLPDTVEEIALDAFGRNIIAGDPLEKIVITGDGGAGVIYGDSNNFALYARGMGNGAAGNEGDALLYTAKSNASVSKFEIPQGVTRIAPFALSGAKHVVECVVPEGVTILYGASFDEMPLLESVTLPVSLVHMTAGMTDNPDDDGTESVPFGGVHVTCGGVFSGCYKLVNVNFQDLENLETIGRRTFTYTSVQEVYIGKNVRLIADSAFSMVAASFEVHPENEIYCSEYGHLYDKAKTELLKGNFKKQKIDDLADTLEVIKSNSMTGCFWLSDIVAASEIVLPENVSIVEAEAISLIGLNKVSIGGGITVIGEMGVYAENIDENYAPLPDSFTVEFRGENPPMLFQSSFNKDVLSVIDVPDGSFEAYYTKFAFAGFSDFIDDSSIKKVTYELKNTCGEDLEPVTAPAVKDVPLPVCSQADMYLQGWFTKDGSTDGDWGERVTFPYFYKGEGSAVSIYAAWGEERYEDGTCAAFAYRPTLGADDEPEDKNRFRIFNGDVFVAFTAEDFGFYELYGTIEILEKHLFAFQCYLVGENGSLERMGELILMPGDTVLLVITYFGLPEEGITDHLFFVNQWAW